MNLPDNPTPRVERKRRRFFLRLILVGLFVGLVVMNAVAFMQARSMTHFVESGARTAPPEALSRWQKIGVILVGVQIPRPINVWTPEDAGLAYQTVRFGGASGQDCEGWYIPVANPKGLCIECHGYAASKSSLLSSAKAFHDLGYDLLLFDFRGSGGSVGDRTSIGYYEAEDVASAVKFAQGKWAGEPLVLYGQSMGGAAILRAVADLGVQPRAIIAESVFDRLLSTVENRFHAMGIPAFPAARLLVFWGGVQNGYDAFVMNPADYATRVKCPVLLFQGGMDPRVSNAQAQNLFNHLAGPKQLVIVQNCGHCAFLSEDRARWISTVTGFLSDR
jgi:alpha-beta hydrolase superfamily lysophospholipase